PGHLSHILTEIMQALLGHPIRRPSHANRRDGDAKSVQDWRRRTTQVRLPGADVHGVAAFAGGSQLFEYFVSGSWCIGGEARKRLLQQANNILALLPSEDGLTCCRAMCRYALAETCLHTYRLTSADSDDVDDIAAIEYADMACLTAVLSDLARIRLDLGQFEPDLNNP